MTLIARARCAASVLPLVRLNSSRSIAGGDGISDIGHFGDRAKPESAHPESCRQQYGEDDQPGADGSQPQTTGRGIHLGQ